MNIYRSGYFHRSIQNRHIPTEGIILIKTFEHNSKHSLLKTVHNTQSNYIYKIRTQPLCTKSRKKLTIPKSALELSLIGFNRIIDVNYNWFGKLIWILIITICMIWALYNISKCFCRYCEKPVSSKIEIHRKNEISFPSITLCTAIIYSSIYVAGSGVSEDDMRIQKFVQNIIKPYANSYDILSQLFIFKKESVSVYVPCENEVTCDGLGQKITVENSTIITLWGDCLVLSPDITLIFRGPSSYLKIIVDISEAFEGIAANISNALRKDYPEFSSILYHVSPKGYEAAKHTIFYFGSQAFSQKVTNLQLSYKQFSSLNTTKKPCFGTKSFIDCQNNCFDEILAENIKCVFEYINSTTTNHKICQDVTSMAEGIREVSMAYSQLNFSKCYCFEVCNKSTYVIRKIVEKATHPYIEIKLYYLDNTFEITREEYEYSINKLIADIGGIFGLFVGFSLLSIMEFIDCLIHRIVHYVINYKTSLAFFN